MIIQVCLIQKKLGRLRHAENITQGQKGLSLHKFLELLGTEENWRAKLHPIRWSTGFRCPQCNYTHFYTTTTRNLYHCINCNHQTFLISGPVFESSKLPLIKCFLAIYFITQSNDGVTGFHLRRLPGIFVNAAFRMKQKIQQAIKRAADRLLLENLVELDDVYWGGKKRGKRGRGAAGKILFLLQYSITTKCIQFTC